MGQSRGAACLTSRKCIGALNRRRFLRDKASRRCGGDPDADEDRRGNLYRAKARPEHETDPAVTLLIAIGRAVAKVGSGAADPDAFLAAPVSA